LRRYLKNGERELIAARVKATVKRKGPVKRGLALLEISYREKRGTTCLNARRESTPTTISQERGKKSCSLLSLTGGEEGLIKELEDLSPSGKEANLEKAGAERSRKTRGLKMGILSSLGQGKTRTSNL